MDEEKLVTHIFENLPSELTEDIFMFLETGLALYLCDTNAFLDAQCTESFWEKKVATTYGRYSKDRNVTWKELARELHAQETEMCFECSQYSRSEEMRQCERCTVQLCKDCGEKVWCVDCQDKEEWE